MSRMLVTRGVVDLLTREIAACGARNVETGGFLLATEARPDRVDRLALAGDVGIQRRRGLFVVSGQAIERLFSWAGERELRIRAQVHSHARGAFLSPTDLRHGFDVNGFITAVVPNFAAPSSAPHDWGWWHRAHGTWERGAAPDVVAGAARAVRFDERGIHAA